MKLLFRFLLALIFFYLATWLPVVLILADNSQLARTILASLHLGIWLSNFLFFWPQYALLPHGFSTFDDGVFHTYLAATAQYIAVLFWFGVGIGYVWMTRLWRGTFFVLGIYPVMFGLTILVQYVLFAFGVLLPIDGP